MSEGKAAFKDEVKLVLEVLMFENWMRFYFIKEEPVATEDGKEEAVNLKMELPEKTLDKIKELYPDLYPLAKEMNGRNIDFETSRTAVLAYVMEAVDGVKMPRGEAQRILSSATFQTDLQLFHTWLQMHETQLDQGFAPFDVWRDMFAKWKESPAALELAENMKKSASNGEN